MELVKQLEKTIEGWLKPLPHLPSAWRKWISENIWWLVIISVVIEVFSIMGIYRAATEVNTFLSYYNMSSARGWSASMLVTITLLTVSTVVMAMAVNYLKEQKRKGWDLLFIATLVSTVSGVASALVSFNTSALIGSLFGAAIGGAIGMYFLFEIRSHFNAATIVRKSK